MLVAARDGVGEHQDRDGADLFGARAGAGAGLVVARFGHRLEREVFGDLAETVAHLASAIQNEESPRPGEAVVGRLGSGVKEPLGDGAVDGPGREAADGAARVDGA